MQCTLRAGCDWNKCHIITIDKMRDAQAAECINLARYTSHLSETAWPSPHRITSLFHRKNRNFPSFGRATTIIKTPLYRIIATRGCPIGLSLHRPLSCTANPYTLIGRCRIALHGFEVLLRLGKSSIPGYIQPRLTAVVIYIERVGHT